MELDALKTQWNGVLDYMLEVDRIAWLAYFDARLVSLVNGTLTISFADSQKMGGQHDFKSARNPKHAALLHEAITKVLNCEFQVIEE